MRLAGRSPYCSKSLVFRVGPQVSMSDRTDRSDSFNTSVAGFARHCSSTLTMKRDYGEQKAGFYGTAILSSFEYSAAHLE